MEPLHSSLRCEVMNNVTLWKLISHISAEQRNTMWPRFVNQGY